MATAIPMDADKELDGADEAADTFFRHLTKSDAETPSDDEDETEEAEDTDEDSEDSEEDDDETSETEEDTPEEDESEDEDDDEDDSDTDAKGKKLYAADNTFVKLKVDGKEIEASVKDLKRLYGQEASLTRKAQEAAEVRKKAEETGQRFASGLNALLERAREQAAPYANINFLALTKDPNVTPEELTALSDAAQKAFENVRYLESELDNVVKQSQAERQQLMAQQARDTIKILSDPKTGIPGWSEQMYNDIRQFAIGAGMAEQVVNEIVDPVALKVLHMAMQYNKGKTAVSNKDKLTKKVDKTPKRIIKGTPDETIKKSKANQKTDAFKKAQTTGHVDDAAEAFLARWES